MKLALLIEARNLRPAIIITRRGVTITADHARWLADGRYLAVGFRPGLHEHEHGRKYRKGQQETALKLARDFYAPPRREPVCERDEAGFCISDSWGDAQSTGYDAGTVFVSRPKFEHIITIRRENVVDVKWIGHQVP